MGIIIAIHVIVCVALIGIILIQRGRGGGFVDSFQGLETVFGTKTNAFLTRLTSILAVVFFVTCLVLAFFSLRQSRSLIGNTPVPPPARTAVPPVQSPASNTTAVQPPIQQPSNAAGGLESTPAQPAPVEPAPVQPPSQGSGTTEPAK